MFFDAVYYRVFMTATVAVAAALLPGCEAPTVRNNENMVGLELGMTTQEVLEQMAAKPDFNEAFRDEAGTEVRIFWYWTTVSWGIPREACTPLVFRGGELQGWGRDWFEETYKKKATPSSAPAPTLDEPASASESQQ